MHVQIKTMFCRASFLLHRTPAAIAGRSAVLEAAEDLVSLLKLMQRTLTLHIKNGLKSEGQASTLWLEMTFWQVVAANQPRWPLWPSWRSQALLLLPPSPRLQRRSSAQDNFAGDLWGQGCSSISDLALQMEQQHWFFISTPHWHTDAEIQWDVDYFIISVCTRGFFLEDVCFAADSTL